MSSNQKALYSEEIKTEVEYLYKINAGGDIETHITDGAPKFVSIYFVNGKFDRVIHNIPENKNGYRGYWYVMAGIANRISEIELSILATKKHPPTP